MHVTTFRFDAPLVREFIEFGRTLYLDDARWIPPFRRTVARQLSPDYPFYNRPGNDHRHFLAYEGSQVVGRASAMVNAAIKDEDGSAVGLIGFFECIEDPVVATVLLDAARDWLRDQHGLRRIWGPMNFDIWHSYRFMTRGFDQAPFYGEPDNKACYPAYFEAYGFARRRQWHSFEVVGRDQLEAMIAASRQQHDRLVNGGYRFVSADNWDPSDETRLLHDLISRSFAGFLGFTPIALEEFAMLFRRSKAAVALPMSFVLHDPSDRPVGFAITYYELSAAVRAMHGRESVQQSKVHGPASADSSTQFLCRRHGAGRTGPGHGIQQGRTVPRRRPGAAARLRGHHLRADGEREPRAGTVSPCGLGAAAGIRSL